MNLTDLDEKILESALFSLSFAAIWHSHKSQVPKKEERDETAHAKFSTFIFENTNADESSDSV